MTERTQGETLGPDQVPTEAGDQDPPVRDPRTDDPTGQPVDQNATNEELGTSPDAAFGQREGQADPGNGGD